MKNILSFVFIAIVLVACAGSSSYYQRPVYIPDTPTPAPAPVAEAPPKPKIEYSIIRRIGAVRPDTVAVNQKTPEGVFCILQKSARQNNLGLLNGLCYSPPNSTKGVPCDVDLNTNEWIRKFVGGFPSAQINGETIYLNKEALMRILLNATSPAQETITLRLISIDGIWMIKDLDLKL